MNWLTVRDLYFFPSLLFRELRGQSEILSESQENWNVSHLFSLVLQHMPLKIISE